MPKAVQYLLLVAIATAAIAWIESGAKARLEAGRLAEAVQAQQRSLADVRRRSEAAGREHADELAAAQSAITDLTNEAAAVPDAPAIHEHCRPGCKPRWKSRPH